MESSRVVLADGAAQGACRAACEAGMSAAVAPDLLGPDHGLRLKASSPVGRKPSSEAN